jgi:hypothetical protein
MATSRELVRALNETRGHGWVYDARTRGAFNIVTQERVSRRQLEKLPGGALAREGFRSYEAKAKARRAQGLSGARQIRPGEYEITVTDKRGRKAAIAALPQRGVDVRVLVQGDDPRGYYPGDGRKRRGVWRTLNLTGGPRGGWMEAGDLLSVWDKRASRAGQVLESPRQWKIRVRVPPRA